MNDFLKPNKEDIDMTDEDDLRAYFLLCEWSDQMKFKPSHFFNDLAVGTGFGLRYDLGFLVIRLDWGVALHSPYDTGKSGYFNIKKFKDAHTLNFAIGYPF